MRDAGHSGVGLSFEDQGTAPSESFGEYLARERSLRNITLEEISQRTRISMRVLQALEEERWDELPADVYVRGFLRTYSRYLGLDENEVLVRYEDQRPHAAVPGRDVFHDLARPRPRRKSLWLMILLLLACTCLAAYWFWARPPLWLDKVLSRPAPPGPNIRALPMPPPPPAGN
jgi:cytoskeleton protein RodZ